MKKPFLAAILALLLGSVLSAAAPPGTRRADLPEGKWWKHPRIAREIELTAEQEDSLEKIFLRVRPELIDLRADLEKKQIALQSAMENPRGNSEEASQKIDEVEKARARLAKARAGMLLEFRRVLSPDQWRRLTELRESRRELRQERLRRPR